MITAKEAYNKTTEIIEEKTLSALDAVETLIKNAIIHGTYYVEFTILNEFEKDKVKTKCIENGYIVDKLGTNGLRVSWNKKG